jgi:hypothetical protein
MLDRYGNVVGIVVAKLDAIRIASRTGDIPQNVNFAIKSSVAFAFLESQRFNPTLSSGGANALTTPEIGELARRMVAQVVCTDLEAGKSATKSAPPSAAAGPQTAMPAFPNGDQKPVTPCPEGIEDRAYCVPYHQQPSSPESNPRHSDRLTELRSEALEFVNRYIQHGNEGVDASLRSKEEMLADHVFDDGKQKSKEELLEEEKASWER